jgi:N-acetylneuraminic acid mutarotase
MIIWGGNEGIHPMDDGARYNPRTDRWTPLPPADLVAGGGVSVNVIWTGAELVVLQGGRDSSGIARGAGGRWNPQTNAWTGIATAGVPGSLGLSQVVWTGDRVLVWRYASTDALVAVSYDPGRDQWAPISEENGLGRRGLPSAVWTGMEMIIWGGARFQPRAGTQRFGDGAAYTPATDTWRRVPSFGFRSAHTAVWTGSEMIVFGGETSQIPTRGPSELLSAGGRYAPPCSLYEVSTSR